MELLNSLIEARIAQLTLQVVDASLCRFVSLIPLCPLSSLDGGEAQILFYLICIMLTPLTKFEQPWVIADFEFLSISQGCRCECITSQPSHCSYKIISRWTTKVDSLTISVDESWHVISCVGAPVSMAHYLIALLRSKGF